MPETNAILHMLVHAERKVYYADHNYEITLWQNGAEFTVEWRATLAYSNVMSGDKKTFSNLDKAKWHVADLLAHPHRLYNQSNYYYDYYSHNDDKKRGTVRYHYELRDGIDDGRLAASVAAGAAQLPEDLAAGEVVRQLWGRTEFPARSAMLRFAQNMPLTYGHWTHWKWLYKQAEAASDVELLPALIARLDTASLEISHAFSYVEQKPSPDTLAYLKRRARRFMKALALRDPALYIRLATQVLRQAGHARSELDLKTQWVSLDILFGKSGRYIQSGHSRGAYRLQRRRPTLTERDEQAAEAWTAQPNLLTDLYSDADLPWQTLEWALKMLLVRKLTPPTLSAASLLRFLQSDSPLLVRAATQQIATQTTRMKAETAARAFFLSNGTLRKQLVARLTPSGELTKWDKDFAEDLSKLVGNLAGAKLSQRQIDAAMLLGSSFAGAISSEAMLGLVPALLSTRRADFVGLVRTIVSNLPVNALPRLLVACAALPIKERQILVNILLTSTSDKAFDRNTMNSLVFAGSEWLRETGWRLLAGSSKLDLAVVSDLWQNVLLPRTSAAVLATAAASPAALGLLIRSSDNLEELQNRLAAQPVVLANLTPEAFSMLVKSFPWSVSLQLIALLDDTRWALLRDQLVAELNTTNAQLGQFWKAAWAAIPTDISGRLATRLLGDSALTQTFAKVDDPGFLETSEPSFGPLLVRWMDMHHALFETDTPILLSAATHKILEVREWALRRLDRVGMGLPFALRLLEAGLPESFGKGRAHFEGLPAGDARELEYALAICDSPDRNVQAYGREYIQKRAATLPAVELTRRLAEHPDAPMQEVVASTLLQTPQLIAAPEVAEFDANILRARDKSRRAKELVKKRVSNSEFLVSSSNTANQKPETRNPKLLLELARSQTPRDAEWAMQQLVQMVRAGQVIEGLEIEGVEGV